MREIRAALDVGRFEAYAREFYGRLEHTPSLMT
jgi:hypothetical protein